MLIAAKHGDWPVVERAYCPPAPRPQPRPLKPLALLRTLKRNPLECWATEHFERPIVAGGLPIGHALLVHEPTAIRRVLLDNAANYRKDRLQRRVLSAGLNEGLLSAEGRAMAPPKTSSRPLVCAQNRHGIHVCDDGRRRCLDQSVVWS